LSISEEEAYLYLIRSNLKQRNILPRYTAIVTFFRTRELKIASNKIPLTFTFIMKSNTQVKLGRNFEKLKMIHKQELRSFQPSDKSAEIKIEIAFIMIKFEIHTLCMYVYSTKF